MSNYLCMCVIVVEDIRYKDQSHNCVAIVIVCAKGVNRGITNKAIVVVYNKLWTVAHRIIRNFNPN